MSAIKDLIEQIDNPELRDRIQQEVDRISKQKKFGLVFEEHLPENVNLYDVPVRRGKRVSFRNPADGEKNKVWTVLKVDNDTAICISGEEKEPEAIPVKDLVVVAEFGEPIYPFLNPLETVCNAPDSDLWHTLIEADNYHALQLLEYLYAGKVDCIYIDPPYNTGARDWKYNNDYVDSSDAYRHSKWLSFMQRRLNLARKLLNPKDSVLIVTIDEKEYLHLGCLLEQMFPEANTQMIIDVINPRGTNRENEFSRVEEYIYVCRFGNASISKTENNMLGNTDEVGKARVWYAFNRGNNPRRGANGQFFPIYIDEKTKQIVQIGEPMPLTCRPADFPKIDGLTAVFPINDQGNESIWRAIPETAREWVKKGYVKVSQFDKRHNRWTLSYIPSGMQERIEAGIITVEGKNPDGSLNITHIDSSDERVSPRTVWNQQYHNATDYGAAIIKKLIPNHPFSYPKSLYAVHDTLRFFVANKPNALILDFFAGSGTTLHAVNLLNAEDGGSRRCIMVTNNEVSEDEAKSLKKQGYQPGDEEWEHYGIARYVNWPRTVCSIKGKDINGHPLKGSYLGCNIPMDKGFLTNAIFFKLGFLDKNEVAIGRQFKNMLPVLWMKAGAKGPCPNLTDEHIPPYMILPANHMAILTKDTAYIDFKAELEKVDGIDTVYLITDSDSDYRAMIRDLGIETSYQIYRDYLDNFRINVKR